MQRGLNRHLGGIHYNRIKVPETLLGLFIKGIIVFLCIYIAARCINLIGSDSSKQAVTTAVNDTTKVIAKEIVENSSIMTQYMLYVENHGSISEEAKKKLLTTVVTDYIKHSEYTYDTTDPGYSQVINLIYENMNAKNEEETTAERETKKKEKSVETASKIIVPIPKVSGTVYTEKKLGSFQNVIDKFYTITSATSINEKDLPIKKALNEEFKIKGSNKKPQILIYHTHSQEEFCNSTGDEGTTIIGVGDRLAKVLKEQFGYNVIHDKSQYDMVDGKLDRNEAYDQARVGVKKILDKNPSISLVLDIHRDGVNSNTHLVTEVNGKKTAQIMFFNGMSRFKTSGNIDYLYNPYLFENLALSLQMKLKAEAYYPGFTRHNYVNAYKYNLDLCRQCMLIEVGAQTNTYQEARNAAEPLAVLVDMVMGDGK
ncbi:MAG: stage II sporulation protein P [Eubacterium sp.]